MRRRFTRLLAGLCLAVAVVALLGIGAAALATRYVFQEPAGAVWSRSLLPELLWQKQQHPDLGWAIDLTMDALAADDPRDGFVIHPMASPPGGPEAWTNPIIGPQKADLAGAPPAAGKTVLVTTGEELRTALRKAEPGSVIQVAPGIYRFSEGSIRTKSAGLPGQPITVRAAVLGAARLEFDIVEGFHVSTPHWVFENLAIDGVCASDSACEHAFHVVGGAKDVVIRNNWVTNFNAAIKVNAVQGVTPDDGVIAHNAFINHRPRQTDKPVTPVDIVAASRWRVRKNVIADFAKAEGNRTSYGAFFKGAGEDNIFEQNLVRCEERHSGGARIGFSFGGGGTKPSVCRDGHCAVEHRRGIARHNIIMDCPNDVGIYLNRSAETLIHNNLLVNTRGIDVRFPDSDAVIVNNVIDGRILAREGARYTDEDNVLSRLKAAFLSKVSGGLYADPANGDFRLQEAASLAGPGAPLEDGGLDLCGQPVDARKPAIGPIQYTTDMACVPVFP